MKLGDISQRVDGTSADPQFLLFFAQHVVFKESGQLHRIAFSRNLVPNVPIFLVLHPGWSLSRAHTIHGDVQRHGVEEEVLRLPNIIFLGYACPIVPNVVSYNDPFMLWTAQRHKMLILFRFS